MIPRTAFINEQSKTDIIVVPLFFQKNPFVLCRSMKDTTLWFDVLCLVDDHFINPTMWSKCHICHILWTNYIFGKMKTLCYINFKNWYNNWTIVFQKKIFVQDIWEMWHFDFLSYVWLMTQHVCRARLADISGRKGKGYIHYGRVLPHMLTNFRTFWDF